MLDITEWKELGERIKELFESKGASGVRMMMAAPAKFSKGWPGNTILLGNLGNNGQMASLNGLCLTLADSISRTFAES